jgi:hypothetical protein
MRRSPVAAALAAVLAVPLSLAAQAGPPTMVATDAFLFVIRGDQLFQFEVGSLRLCNTFRFPAAGDVAPEVASQIEVPRRPSEKPSRKSTVDPAALRAAAPPTSAGVAVQNALQWLADHQSPDGRWDADGFMAREAATAPRTDGPGNPVHDVGVTGLALLAFLGNGNTLRSGPHEEQCRNAAKWLQEQQQANGLFGQPAAHDFIYDHAIATYALSEAAGLSESKQLRETVQKGIDYLESHRNPYAVWRYQPRDNDNDTSVTAWAVHAYASANFFRLRVNQDAMKVALQWFDTVTDAEGRAGYTKAGERSSRKPGNHGAQFPPERGEAMTAAAMCGRLLLGQTPSEQPVLAAAAKLLQQSPPAWQQDRIDAVYWYFGSQALAMTGGPAWEVWRQGLLALVNQQCSEGHARGSWDPIGVWDADGGRVFVTALYALCLSAEDRYSRLVR